MLIEEHKIDERVRSSARWAAAIWLGVTQVLLAGVIFYRLYVLDQPDAELRDFQAVLAVSIFGFIGMQLLLGGVFPTPTWKGALIGYLVLMGIIAGGCLLIFGVPPIEDWASTWLPAVLGPALFIGLYWLVAWLGKRRLDRQIEG